MPSRDTQFQPGQPRPTGAGRKPGTPNKRSAALNNALTDLAIDILPTIKNALEKMYIDSHTPYAEYIGPALRFLSIVRPLSHGTIVQDHDDENIVTLSENKETSTTTLIENNIRFPNTTTPIAGQSTLM